MPKLKFNHSPKLNPGLLMLIYGGSQSGKTHLLFNMLLTDGILDYDNLIIFTNTPEQSYYQFLKSGFENNLSKYDIKALFDIYEEDDNIDISDIENLCKQYSKIIDTSKNKPISITITNDRNQIQDPSELLQNKKHGIIFDDCINDRDQSLQRTFFTRGRHCNCFCIYISQSFYNIDKNSIRKNANVFILFSMSPRDKICLLQDIDVGDKERFNRICDRQWDDPLSRNYIGINIFKPKNDRIFTDLFS